jgi:hypothetical protein
MSTGAILTDLQNDLAGYMLQCENLDHLNIVVDDMGTIDSDAQKAVSTVKSRGGTQGIAAIILRPTVSSANANMPGPQSEAIITIQMAENVLVNRSGKGSKILPDDMSFRILSSLHHLTLGNRTVFAEPVPVRPLPAPPGFVSYEIILRVPLYNTPLERTRTPEIDNDGGTITLTSQTPSSAFQYSLDGSYPSLTYTAPFSASSGDLVRALATSASILPSSISELTID